MRLPFTADEFFDTFRRYNEAVWPAQWLFYALALWLIVAALRDVPARSHVTAPVLAFLWLWMGIAYHIAVFRSVNPAALIFGFFFVLQGALFAWIGVRR